MKQTFLYEKNHPTLSFQNYYNFLNNSLFNIIYFEDAKTLIKKNCNKYILSEIDFFTYRHNFGFGILFRPEDTLYINRIIHTFSSLNIATQIIPNINFILLIWEDDEKEINFLDCNVISKFFIDILSFKNFIFKSLSLKDIYFSSKYNRFIIKNFSKFIYLKDLNISESHLSYNPKNILLRKTLHTYIEEPLTYTRSQNYFNYWGN